MVLMALQSESASDPQSRACAERVSATVLVLEDPLINNFLRAVLQRHGHKVVIVQPEQCADLKRSGIPPADLVVTNRPEAFLPFADTLPVIYIAASPDPVLASQFHMCRVLPKPFRNDDLLEAVGELARRVVP